MDFPSVLVLLIFNVIGFFIIGFFVKNKNDRKDLAIYKLDANKPDSLLYKISYTYPDQTEFPPKKSGWLFDVEAFISYKGSFYLFTKNRSKGFDGTVLAQKALSCVYRMGQSFGMHHVIDVLRGSQNQRILELGQDKLSTYGIGKDIGRF